MEDPFVKTYRGERSFLWKSFSSDRIKGGLGLTVDKEKILLVCCFGRSCCGLDRWLGVVLGGSFLKYDLVMWTKNAGFNLRLVLDRIDEVVPKEAVGQKIMIDDGSFDNTKFVGAMHDWTVIANRKGGIAAAANQALEMVKSPIFFSFEQDLLLARDWFQKVPPLIGGNTIAASGVRLPDKPRGLRKLHEFIISKYQGDAFKNSRLKSRRLASFGYGRTFDNTAWDTAAVRKLGGFPMLKTNSGVDTVFAVIATKGGYDWQVDVDCWSDHLRRNLRDDLRHYVSYGREVRLVWKYLKDAGFDAPEDSLLQVLVRALVSPLSGLRIAWVKKEASIVFIQTAIRFSVLWGRLRSF